MQMSDKREIKADPATVFAALLDPDMLKHCVPGAETVEGNPQDGYTATVTQKVGPVKATFKGQVTMSDMVENERLTITGEGKGGAAGFAKGGADVRLTRTGSGHTLLEYDVEAKVGGKLAQLGSRLIDGFAKKMADQFFTTFQEQIEGPTPPDVPPETAEGEKKGWFRKVTGRA